MLLKLFGRREEEDERFAARAAVVRDLGIRITLVQRMFVAAMLAVPALATALVYGVGGHLALNGALTVGTLLALATLLVRLLGPLQGLSNVRIDVMTALVSFERVFEVLDLPSLIQEKPDAVPLPGGAARLEFDHVRFAYPRPDDVSLASLETVARAESRDGGPVLHDVTFTAEPGQMVALVGPSGAGKTTITHLVARLYDVTSGAVRVDGIDVRDVTLQSLEDAVGYVTQDAHMFHDTIRENLRYARPAATDEELWRALDAAQIGTLVRALPDGLDTVVGDRGYRLSGGERQRLAIARLLLKAPSIVVLDEATAHLDSESEVAVQRALDQALEGRTSLVIAHRLSTVRNADLILVVDGGRVVQSGSHAQLLAQGGLYADLYETQFAVRSA
jgi:ATP-binding cassette subfamily B protein